MIHETETETTHVVTFTEQEATQLGEFILKLQESSLDNGASLDLVFTQDLGYQDLLQLANYLNGVE